MGDDEDQVEVKEKAMGRGKNSHIRSQGADLTHSANSSPTQFFRHAAPEAHGPDPFQSIRALYCCFAWLLRGGCFISSGYGSPLCQDRSPAPDHPGRSPRRNDLCAFCRSTCDIECVWADPRELWQGRVYQDLGPQVKFSLN